MIDQALAYLKYAFEFVNAYVNWQFVIDVGMAVAMFGAALGAVPFLTWAERKVVALIQDRWGPERVGPIGLLQPFADGLKSFFKEDFVPAHVDKVLFTIAPALAFIPPALVFSAIPVAHRFELYGFTFRPQALPMDMGMLFVLMVVSLSGYGVIFGSVGSNNKWSLLAGLRGAAQMISYELLLGLSFLAVIMCAGTTDLYAIVEAQSKPLWGTFVPSWYAFTQPVAFLLFLVAGFAETNRVPFDLVECDSELVAGYFTEYSSMKFAMFFMAEYVSMIAISALIVTLFLGGWSFPGIVTDSNTLLNSVLSGCVFAGKMTSIIFGFMWVRWTLPRFRYDQLMKLSWKALLPLGILNLMATAAVGLFSNWKNG